MSSHYNFRSRAGAPAVPSAEETGESSISTALANHAVAGSPLLDPPDSMSNPDGMRLRSKHWPGITYSQVAGSSRPPTPNGSETVCNTFAEADKAPCLTVSSNRKLRTTVEEAMDEEEGCLWITVQRHCQRACSVDSYPVQTGRVLNSPQLQTVCTTEANLSMLDHDCIDRRMEAVKQAGPLLSKYLDSSQDEGPSSLKDKGRQ